MQKYIKAQPTFFSESCAFCLFTNQFIIDNFGDLVTDAIHPSNPLHLILRFEFFCHTLALCYLFYQLGKHFFRLLVNISKITV